MKKLLCIILVILVVFTSGCHNVSVVDSDVGVSSALNGNDTGESTNSDHSDIEYRIYADPYCGENTTSSYTDQQSCTIVFEDISEKDFFFSNRTEVENEKADAQRELVLPDRTVSVNYSRSFTNPLTTCAQNELRPLGSFDEYRCEVMGGSVTVRFRQADDELVFYSATDQRDVTGSLTEQDAKALADAFLEEKYGSEFMTEYPDCEIVTTNDSISKSITAGYIKHICGYPTTDRVLVTYNMNGELKAFNAMTKGLFAPIQDEITHEKIANAENALLNTISDSWDIYWKSLALDVDGRCYLHIMASRDNSDLPEGVELADFYINID